MTADLPEVTFIERYHYEPGDKIIARCPGRIDMAKAQLLREHVSARLGVPVSDVLVAADGIVIEVIGGLHRDVP